MTQVVSSQKMAMQRVSQTTHSHSKEGHQGDSKEEDQTKEGVLILGLDTNSS